jgi:hypothetical protein
MVTDEPQGFRGYAAGRSFPKMGSARGPFIIGL